MARSFKSGDVNIIFFSHPNFKTPDFRVGLLERMADDARKRKSDFAIIAGGLTSQKSLREQGLLPKKPSKASLESDNPKVRERAEELLARYNDFARSLAKEFAEVLPRVSWREEEPMKYYIVTSPVDYFDGEVGTDMAKQLAMIRDDVRFYGVGHSTVWIKGMNKYIRVLVPVRALWASDYYSTPVKRLINDDRRRSHSPNPLFYAVGCVAASIYKPQGESPRPYIVIPDLRKLEDTRSVENQIGTRVVTLKRNSGKPRIIPTNFNYKDLVQKERAFLQIPSRATELERRILGQIKKRGRQTVGEFAESLNVEEQAVQEAIENMSRFPTVGLVFDPVSHKYDFRHEWLQEHVRYPWPQEREFIEERIAAFSCLHAGSPYEDMDFWVQRVPEFLFENNVRYLVGCGDFVEGWAHRLLQRGESKGNITQQETDAATLVGIAMIKDFEWRIVPQLEKRKRRLRQRELATLVSSSLMEFYYRKGNHDDWGAGDGHTPLVIFGDRLVRFLYHGIKEILARYSYNYSDLLDLVETKVHEEDRFTLPSGLKVSFFHPYLARTKTHSIRLQEYLDFAEARGDADIVIIGNFHTSLAVEHWEPGDAEDDGGGQRVGLQVPTIKISSDFEYNKGKLLDFGVGLVRAKTFKGKIYESTVEFLDEPMLSIEEAEKSKLDQSLYEERRRRAGLAKEGRCAQGL